MQASLFAETSYLDLAVDPLVLDERQRRFLAAAHQIGP
jgi:hypothetical protein